MNKDGDACRYRGSQTDIRRQGPSLMRESDRLWKLKKNFEKERVRNDDDEKRKRN